MFFLRYLTEYEQDVHDWKLRVLTKEYTACFTEVLNLLTIRSEKKELTINLYNIGLFFNKLSFRHWQNNPIEWMFLSPLHKSFLEMQVWLCYMYSWGINYWKL